MSDMVCGFEYFWAMLLLLVMERICCLQEQFDKDYIVLPEVPTSDNASDDSINLEVFPDTDSLKQSFLRLCRHSQVTMLLTLFYFCNVSFWFVMTKKASPITKSLTFSLLDLKHVIP